MLPLLLPGYIFALDMAFKPTFPMPDDFTASYLLRALLHFLSLKIPSWILQKIILFGILVLSGVGIHKLADSIQRTVDSKINTATLYFAGILYIVNPFTYERFMDGHWLVLLGHALMPWFANGLFKFVFEKKRDAKSMLKLSGWTVLISIVSIHAIGMLVILFLSTLLVGLYQSRSDKREIFSLAKSTLLVGAVVIAASLYWLVPAFTGSTKQSELIGEFDARHFLTFKTAGKSDIDVIGNVAAMYGYWGETQERYIVPKHIVPFWQVLAAAIIALVLYGAYMHRKSPYVKALGAAALLAFVIAVGIAAQPFATLNYWLLENIPFFSGFREPQKFVSLLVLVYAVLGALGLSALLNLKWFKKRKEAAEWLVVGALVLPVLYTPLMFWGFAGQLHASDYPADWYSVNSEVVAQAEGKTLFLPWNQYLYFDFAGRVIANPAPGFFGKGEVIAGDNAEIGLIKRQVYNPESEYIESLLADRDKINDFGSKLKQEDFQYVILAKTADWSKYDFLDQQEDLRLVQETETLRVYENTAY